MHAKRTACVALAILSLSGCAGGHSQPGDHSVADVSAALRAVGLDSFRPISNVDMGARQGTRGVSSDKFAGGFWFVRHGGVGQHPPFVVISIAVMNDPSVIGKLKAEAKKRRASPPVNVRLARAGNVVIVSVSEHPDAADRGILARIPKLVRYLDNH